MFTHYQIATILKPIFIDLHRNERDAAIRRQKFIDEAMRLFPHEPSAEIMGVIYDTFDAAPSSYLIDELLSTP